MDGICFLHTIGSVCFSCRAPSRPSRLHLRVFGFFCYCFVLFLTINLSEAYQSSSPTCLFCHLTTPAEMMLCNTHTDVPHTTNSRTQAKEALIFFAVLLKLKTCLNLSVPDVIV